MSPQKITVYDPPMCCPTGVCGQEVDPQLARFAADLEWLSAQGVSVRRYNLAMEPGFFASDADAKDALERHGESALPLIKAGEEVVSSGAYPTRDELAAWAGLASSPSLYSKAVAELVALGAAIAANCQPCFSFHYEQARKLGVSREDVLRAATTAQKVKDVSAHAMLDQAQRCLSSDDAAAAAEKSSCCGPATGAGGASGCC